MKCTKLGLICVALIVLMSVAKADKVDCKKFPKRVDPSKCCDMPELISDEINEKCRAVMRHDNDANDTNDDDNENDAEDRPSPRPHPRPSPHPHPQPHPHPHPPHHACFMSCLLNETGIMVDDKLNEAKLQEYLDEHIEEEAAEILPVLKQAFKTCQTRNEKFKSKVMEHMKMSPPTDSTSKRMARPFCSPASSMLIGCTFMETYKNCPASAWTDSEECNASREFITKCKPGRMHWKKSDSSETEEM